MSWYHACRGGIPSQAALASSQIHGSLVSPSWKRFQGGRAEAFHSQGHSLCRHLLLQLSWPWDSNCVPILHGDNPDDTRQLTFWQTDAVIPSYHCLCWIDYYRGILFCDMFGGPTPTVSFIRFPLEQFPSTPNRSIASSWLYRGVSVIDAGRGLKFVDVARDDGIGYGALKPGAGFTITCHTLSLGSSALKKDRSGGMVWTKDTLGRMLWKKGSMVTSKQLWSTNYPTDLPHGILMFPQVNIAKPHVVHFLLIEFGSVLKKMWLVAINMNTGTVQSSSLYINGKEDRGNMDFDLTKQMSICPKRFLPCELFSYLDCSR